MKILGMRLLLGTLALASAARAAEKCDVPLVTEAFLTLAEQSASRRARDARRAVDLVTAVALPAAGPAGRDPVADLMNEFLRTRDTDPARDREIVGLFFERFGEPILYRDIAASASAGSRLYAVMRDYQRIVEDRRTRASRRSSHCLTGDMRVATPLGYVKMRDLVVGQVVTSFDFDRQRLTSSRVAKIQRTDDQPYGLVDTGEVRIEATAGHRFLLYDSGFTAIGDADGRSAFLKLVQDRGVTWVKGATWTPAPGTATVFDIMLEDGPSNFFVEDLLVHNAKISG